jgi:hypothetical protein
MCPAEVDVEEAPFTARPRRKRNFARTGFRSPANMAPTCCNNDDWTRQTLQGLLLEVATLRAIMDGTPMDCPSDAMPAASANSDEAMRYHLDNEYATFLAHEQQMQKFYKNPPPPLPPNVTEIVGDIFLDAPDTMALGHSVAEDFEMSAGIAVDFKNKFGQVDRLLSMGRTVGQVAVLPVAQPDGSVRYVFYIITKKRSRGTRPNLGDFSDAVHDLAAACTLLGVKQLALPRIGTMKDRLQWSDVRNIIGAAFEGRETEVFVFRRGGEEKRDKLPTTVQLADFVDRMLQKTPHGSHQQQTLETPLFSTPESATPPAQTSADTRSCPLPDEGVPAASATGPCATNVVSEKNEDAGCASSLDTVDSRKSLTTAQGPDRSVQKSTTPALNRLFIDLEKYSSRKRSSSIPRPITPTEILNKKHKNIDVSKSPDVLVNSDSQCQRQPPNEEQAGRRTAASLRQRSSASRPADPQEGDAQQPIAGAANQNLLRAPIVLGGYRAHRQHLLKPTGMNNWPKNTNTKSYYTQR